MRVVAVLLAIGELLALFWRAVALGAGTNTAVGVVGLGRVGARDVVAFGNAAGIVAVTWLEMRD